MILKLVVVLFSNGTSNTIAIAEDAARREFYITNGSYSDPAVSLGINNDYSFPLRRFWRWGEQDSGFGVSGDPLLNRTTTSFKIINNNNQQASSDGPSGCWKLINNCGPNDEIFSFHTGGANVMFCDGHVSFLTDSLSPVIVSSLASRAGGETVPTY